MRNIRRFSACILLLFLLSAGCYTVINHPSDVQVPEDFQSENQAGIEDPVSCGECHYESEWLGYYEHSLIWGYPVYDGRDSWYDYYQKPWWYDGYWYDGHHHYTETGSTSGGRSWWEKRTFRRGDDSFSSGTGGVFPGSSRPKTPADTNTGSASPSSDTSTKEKAKPAPQPAHGKKKPRG